MRRKHGRLTIEPEDGAVDVRLFQEDADVVDEVAGREIVGTVDHHIVVAEDLHGVFAGERGFEFIDLQVRVDVLHGLCRRVELLLADVFGAMNHLALQISEIDHVEINDTDAANAGGRQV